MQIKIYTKAYCSYCYAAKHLLMKRGLAFEETDLSGNFPAEQEMRDLTGRTTVPQIVINGTSIGGYTDLIELDRAGKLDAFRATSEA
jgi:glutaredoxin 3